MLVVWRGRGAWVIWLVAIAAFLPMIVLRQIDGPEVDRGVAITMGLAALGILGLGLRWNRGATFDASAQEHSLWNIPMQLWALPVALFAVLLATGVITTAEEPRPARPAARVVGGMTE
jgi:hypothetical protein